VGGGWVRAAINSCTPNGFKLNEEAISTYALGEIDFNILIQMFKYLNVFPMMIKKVVLVRILLNPT